MDLSNLAGLYPVLFLLITVLGLMTFFHYYINISRPAPGTTEWITRIMTKPKFTIFFKRHRMARRDILPMALITAVCAFLGFFKLGDLTAPESFHRFTSDRPSTVITLNNPTEIGGVMYYTGLWTGSYTLEFSADGVDWQRQNPKGDKESAMNQPYSDLFKWLYADVNEDNGPATYIRITADKTPLALGEIALYTKAGDRLSPDDFTSEAPALTDEQDLIPEAPSYMNSMYFDEIYHGRTAYEYLQGEKAYETTHPPLGKLIIAVGIQLFGMVPFGWRFMGTLFGVLMLPIFYVFLKNMFGKTEIAVCGTTLFGMDFMRFVQTRIATIDTYGVMFILLAYFFMYRYMTGSPEARFIKTLPNLALSGLFFGIGCACKWTVVYAGAGLLALFLLRLVMWGRYYKENEIPGYLGLLVKTLLSAFAFYIALPAVIYCLSYIPNGIIAGMRLKDGMLWNPDFYRLIWDNQTFMFRYHSQLEATHSYSSVWWQWITDARPILYYRSYPASGIKSSFAAFGNPLVWWGGFMAIIAMGFRFFLHKDGKALFILIGYLSQLLPWLFISRVVFIYHYFPSTLFLILALSHVLNTIWERGRGRYKLAVFGLTAASVFLFGAFYPVITGVPVSEIYTRYFLRWIPTAWPF